MGNASSGSLPFKLGEKLEYESPQSLCELLRGHRTDKDDVAVAVFRYNRSTTRIPLAQRHFTKLRTLRHPYIVNYIDGVELEDGVMVVTEELTPLQMHIRARMAEKSITTEELVWGFKCIAQALSFLHSNCGFIHGFLGMHAVFVAKSGDWKLGRFDLTISPTSEEDESFFSSHESVLQDKYRSSERSNLRSVSSPLPVDIFSLGVVMQETFAQTGLAMPSDLEQLVRRMVMSDPRRRPGMALVLRSACFSNEKMAILALLDELVLKSTAEAVEALSQFNSTESVAAISSELCSFKLLPCVGRILSSSLEDFAQRDGREAARQAISSALNLLALLGGTQKLNEKHLGSSCLNQLVALWGLSDRAVRTCLLKTLPALVPFMSTSTINGKVFDPLLSGFADNNLKMREDTLKSLVCLLDKLDEKNLQEKLVRCMCGLQSDSEAAIRTNATIFIGRIAPKLRDAVKAKVLCSAYAKAIKDQFQHCRVAGLKAALASLSILVEVDYLQLVGKLMPQVCTLLTDRSEETRRLALQFVEELCGFVKEKHQEQAKLEEAAAAKAAKAKLKDAVNPQDSSKVSSTEPSKQVDSWGMNWTSWAVESISKSLEQATVVDAPHIAEIVVKKKLEAPLPTKKLEPTEEAWDFDDDMDFDDNAKELPTTKTTKTEVKKLSSNPKYIKETTSGSWDEDEDEELMEETKVVNQKTNVGKSQSQPVNQKPNQTKNVSGWGDSDDDFDEEITAKKPTPSSVRNQKKTVVKSSSDTGWEDDDELDISDDEMPKPTKQFAVSSTASKKSSDQGNKSERVRPKSSLKSVANGGSNLDSADEDSSKILRKKSSDKETSKVASSTVNSKRESAATAVSKSKVQTKAKNEDTKSKAPKATVKRLEMDKGEWDDDW